MRTYCKIIEYNVNDPTHYSCSFLFGAGQRRFCMVAAYDNKIPNSIYIDRVEYNKACSINQDLSAVGDGTAKLVRIGLYAMHLMKPDIQRFTLKDESHIFCNGANGPKISLSHETILKYNQTWYQQKFGAVLPGFISMHTEPLPAKEEDYMARITISIQDQSTTFRVMKDSLMQFYLESLAILDMPCEPFDSITDKLSALKKYKEDYEVAHSPRDFMKRLRERFSKEQYCKEGVLWYQGYMDYLRIRIFYDAWYIPVEAIEKPVGFQAKKMTIHNVERVLSGGAFQKRRKTAKNTRGLTMMPYNVQWTF